MALAGARIRRTDESLVGDHSINSFGARPLGTALSTSMSR
jgi:hypothetical protein